MYIREARRIVGEHVFCEGDGLYQQGTLRAKLHPTSIATADYNFNCHGIQPPQPIHPNVVEGDFSFATAPIQVPYGVLVPKGMANLLVPVAVSATHVGYSILRMEPTYAAMGQTAGLAAHLELKAGVLVKDVPVPTLQTILHERKAQTIYTADVPDTSPYFRAVQFFGNRGFLHVLPEATEGAWQPARYRFSLHYTHAMPHQEVRPNAVLDAKLFTAWTALLSEKERIPFEAAGLRPDGTLSRGKFLNRLYTLVRR